ncbi:hypothetical protein [Maritalea sp.]|uniref:hypothetical protein n=1 Tax=Maritalea sp. TaxID=2003361 RepID=UPI003EF6B2CB
MKFDVNCKREDGALPAGLAKRRHDLRGIVRFLAHRAAERAWSAMQNAEDSPKHTRGDSP